MSIGGGSEDLGNVAGLFDVTGQSDYPRSVVNLEQVMDAPSDDIRTLVDARRLWWNAVAGILWSIVCPPSSFPGLVTDWTCLRVDCSHEWVSHHGVARLSHLKLHLSVKLLCQQAPIQHHHPFAFLLLMVFLGH